MSKQSNPRLGLGPLLSSLGSPRTDHLRVSDAERQAVADRLAEHYGEGRLDQAEFDDRISRAMSAKTRADFSGLFDDLPEPGPTGAPGTYGVAGAGAATVSDRRARREMRRHRHHHHGLLTVALVVVVLWVAVHAVGAFFWFAGPWLWLGLIAVILLVATGHIGHSHSRSGESSEGDGDR
jgi:hypothetical protein